MKTITITLTVDDDKVEQVNVTDILNEVLHELAVNLDLEPNPETGGYIEMDWSYAVTDRVSA
jgi:hypothetical protein